MSREPVRESAPGAPTAASDADEDAFPSESGPLSPPLPDAVSEGTPLTPSRRAPGVDELRMKVPAEVLEALRDTLNGKDFSVRNT